MRRGNKARFLLNTLKKTPSWGSPLLVLIQFFGSGVGVVAYLSLSGGGGWGGRLFEAGHLLTFPAFRMGAYSRWELIRGWALIRINTVVHSSDLAWISLVHLDEVLIWLSFRKIYVSFSKTKINVPPTMS